MVLGGTAHCWPLGSAKIVSRRMSGLGARRTGENCGMTSAAFSEVGVTSRQARVLGARHRRCLSEEREKLGVNQGEMRRGLRSFRYKNMLSRRGAFRVSGVNHTCTVACRDRVLL